MYKFNNKKSESENMLVSYTYRTDYFPSATAAAHCAIGDKQITHIPTICTFSEEKLLRQMFFCNRIGIVQNKAEEKKTITIKKYLQSTTHKQF